MRALLQRNCHFGSIPVLSCDSMIENRLCQCHTSPWPAEITSKVHSARSSALHVGFSFLIPLTNKLLKQCKQRQLQLPNFRIENVLQPPLLAGCCTVAKNLLALLLAGKKQQMTAKETCQFSVVEAKANVCNLQQLGASGGTLDMRRAEHEDSMRSPFLF